MFTKDQGYELINRNNTTSTWTSINGVTGYKFSNKTNYSKYIFLPAGGRWDDTGHDGAGSYGRYWSTAYTSSSNACNIGFDSSTVSWYNYDNRHTGRSIRPVRQL